MSAEQNKQLIKQFYEDVWHTKDTPAYDKYLAPEASSYREQIEQIRATMPDIHFHLGEMIAEDDAVVARWTGHGTNADGERSEIDGISLWHIRDGKIIDRYAARPPE